MAELLALASGGVRGVGSHWDRRILHLNVTAHPTEEWTKQQLREAFPWASAPRYFRRDRDKLYRELLAHAVVLNEAHDARCLLREHQRYYNASRTHLSLGKDAPEPREVQGPEHGAKVIELREVFGLHHRYKRRAA
ncbi:hypothetical protein HV826_07635 [Myxococcus sp. AM010]|nr:hypothetical protein [Myxococcus sp. AM010]